MNKGNSKTSKIKRARKHGFHERMKENYSVIKARRQKGRWKLTV